MWVVECVLHRRTHHRLSTDYPPLDRMWLRRTALRLDHEVILLHQAISLQNSVERIYARSSSRANFWQASNQFGFQRARWVELYFFTFPPLHFADCENFTRLPLGAGLSKVTTEFPSVPLNTMQVQSSESERGADRSQCRTHLASCAEWGTPSLTRVQIWRSSIC